MTTKVCFKCEEEKELSEFYKCKGNSDGHSGKCKECAKKDSIANRNKRIEYYREYDRNRGNLDHRVEMRKKYAQTPEGKIAASKGHASWKEKNTIKRAAHILVGNSLRDGKLERETSCESCGCNEKLHAHHDDYAKPLDVRWLCSKCHREWHKENGGGLNG